MEDALLPVMLSVLDYADKHYQARCLELHSLEDLEQLLFVIEGLGDTSFLFNLVR